MNRIDEFEFKIAGRKRRIQLLEGNIVDPSAGQVDAIVISAFPDDYTPTETSVIGSLKEIGVDVDELSKQRDRQIERTYLKCWVSPVIERPGIYFRRIICIEPMEQKEAPEVVRHLYDCINSLLPTARTIAMPILASGDQQNSPLKMFEELVHASIGWLSLPFGNLDEVKIVIKAPEEVQRDQEPSLRETETKRLKQSFQRIRSLPRPRVAGPEQNIDVFISYSRADAAGCDVLADELKARRPDVKVFIDRKDIDPGSAWQSIIDEAVSQARLVACLLSPNYIESEPCRQEYFLACGRHDPHGSVGDGLVVYPIYYGHVPRDLPEGMRELQFDDAREEDIWKLREIAGRIIKHLGREGRSR